MALFAWKLGAAWHFVLNTLLLFRIEYQRNIQRIGGGGWKCFECSSSRRKGGDGADPVPQHVNVASVLGVPSGTTLGQPAAKSRARDCRLLRIIPYLLSCAHDIGRSVTMQFSLKHYSSPLSPLTRLIFNPHPSSLILLFLSGASPVPRYTIDLSYF